jgi:quercetin dioxygenase-like cupin family protein
MLVVEGEVEMTIEDDTTMLAPGDVVVVNRGLHHKLYSENGVTFMEALSPVPLDHVPDKALDLVLGPDGGSQHVES